MALGETGVRWRTWVSMGGCRGCRCGLGLVRAHAGGDGVAVVRFGGSQGHCAAWVGVRARV